MIGILRADVDGDRASSGIVRAGGFCFLTRCVGDPDGTLEDQVNGAFDDMERRLAAVGLAADSVVRLDCVFRDLGDVPAAARAMRERFRGRYPATRCLQGEIEGGVSFQADAVAWCGGVY